MSKIKDILYFIFRGNDARNEPDMFEIEGYYSQSKTYSQSDVDLDKAYRAAKKYFKRKKRVDRDRFLASQKICPLRDMQKILGILYREKKIAVDENGVIEYLEEAAKKKKDKAPKVSTRTLINRELATIDSMEGFAFERYTCELLRKIGFQNAVATQKSNDYGVDVLATKDNVRYAVQCKRYSGKVGNKAVQEVGAGLNYYKAQKGVVLTNSYYTDNAIKLAKANNIILWDRAALSQLIEMKLTKKEIML